MEFQTNRLSATLRVLALTVLVAGCSANGGIGGGGGDPGNPGNPGNPGEDNCPSSDLEECPTGNMGVGFGPIGAGSATATSDIGPGCLVCSVDNPENVLSGSQQQQALISAMLGILPAGGLSSAGIVVDLNSTQNPSNRNPGFDVSFPAPSTLLNAGVLPDLTISTLLDGDEVSSTTYAFGILANSVGVSLAGVLIPNDAIVFLGTETNEPYNQLRIDLTGIAGNVILDINVHQAYLDGISGSIDGDFPL